eukprot:CAMPEP_0178912008 /NCGR_PEP_ID=MMETSP0786-20121207/10018_1 /TAXON_ID=186022 /ORGANISM="Thalassionema frauenfeldii, Strain CCMP 1798" /LENGTH=609 /DNA_ID=CAMNT_0020584531 /DNA_START=108 /DNA_END=1937 /DNA_ORIENTATION=-
MSRNHSYSKSSNTKTYDVDNEIDADEEEPEFERRSQVPWVKKGLPPQEINVHNSDNFDDVSTIKGLSVFDDEEYASARQAEINAARREMIRKMQQEEHAIDSYQRNGKRHPLSAKGGVSFQNVAHHNNSKAGFVEQANPKKSDKKRSRSNFGLCVVLIIILAASGGVAFFLVSQNQGSDKSSLNQSAESSTVATSIPTSISSKPTTPPSNLSADEESPSFEPTKAEILTSNPSDQAGSAPDPTFAPVQPTLAPVDPTFSPVQPTLAPVVPTLSTVQPNLAPVDPTLSPVQPTLLPVDPTLSPVQPTLLPVDPTLAPVEPTVAPVDPTFSPVQPTLTPTPVVNRCPEVPSTGCSVCGEGKCVSNFEAEIVFPGVDQAYPCGVLEIAGLQGLIPLDTCTAIPSLIGACECVQQPLASSIQPSPAPVGSIACPVVPDNGCSVCGEGKCITNPDAIFEWPGQPAISCYELQEAGYDGFVLTDECELLPPLVGVCGCAPAGVPPAPTISTTETPVTIEPVEPTECPVVPEDGCNICGSGNCITNPDAIFEWPDQPPATCHELQEAGYVGLISLDECKMLLQLIGGFCGCEPGGVPAAQSVIAAPEQPSSAPTDL